SGYERTTWSTTCPVRRVPPPPWQTEVAHPTAVEEDEAVWVPEEDPNVSETGSRGRIPQDDEDVEDPDEDDRGSTRGDSVDAEELGLVADDEYVSPQHDIDVLWDDRWEFDPSLSDPIGSDTESGIDWVVLTWLDGDGIFEIAIGVEPDFRSEERRVGKECR